MPREMKRIVNIAKGFKEAEEWDIRQQIKMTPDERFAVAKKLQEMFYGKNVPDVRQWHRKK
jgi:hypothetical protein